MTGTPRPLRFVVVGADQSAVRHVGDAVGGEVINEVVVVAVGEVVHVLHGLEEPVEHRLGV